MSLSKKVIKTDMVENYQSNLSFDLGRIGLEFGLFEVKTIRHSIEKYIKN